MTDDEKKIVDGMFAKLGIVTSIGGWDSPTQWGGVHWQNFRTGKQDSVTPTDFSDYIPQFASAQSLYQLYVEDMGYTPLDAAIEVLRVCVGALAGQDGNE